MKENLRKCIMCGSSSSQDASITLHRFPKPGRTNSLRCELWAKYCFPNEPWSSPKFQRKLFSQHKMLCSKHFLKTCFFDQKLFRTAVPSEECDEENYHLMQQPQQKPFSTEAVPVTPIITPELPTPGHIWNQPSTSKEIYSAVPPVAPIAADHNYCRNNGRHQRQKFKREKMARYYEDVRRDLHEIFGNYFTDDIEPDRSDSESDSSSASVSSSVSSVNLSPGGEWTQEIAIVNNFPFIGPPRSRSRKHLIKSLWVILKLFRKMSS